MQYSIIYSVDVPATESIRSHNPIRTRKDRKRWECTEDDAQYEYSYLEGRWSKGKHRKYCGILDAESFRAFCEEQGFCPESTPTMGSIGAPGDGMGWAPAISFRTDDEDAIKSAYVTPSGTREELIAYLREHDVNIPLALMDDPAQAYLWDDVYDDSPVWASIVDCVMADFED